MKFVLASDHKGKEIKDRVISILEELEVPFDDLSPTNENSDDYPNFAKLVAKKIGEDFGFLSCGTGIGISIAANRFKNVRAALVHSKKDAMLSRAHNNANVLVLNGSYDYSDEELLDIITLFIETKFEGGRHKRRVDLL
jgi:ribose 5-phosphate isomerase B